MRKSAKLILIPALVTLVTSACAHAQQTWEPDHFDPGRAPQVALPTTPGVSINGGFSGYSQPTPTPPAAQTVPQSTPPMAPDETTTVKNEQKGPAGASGSPATPKEPPKTANTSKTPPTASMTERKYFKGMVLSGSAVVIDGHSLVVDGHPVRLNGIEAPALRQMCNTSSMTPWPCGAKSAQRLVQLIDSDVVTCNVTSQAGHGAAAVCGTRSIKDLGKMLVFEGLAVPNGHGFGYANDTATAEKSRKGLFTGSFVHPARWRIQNPS